MFAVLVTSGTVTSANIVRDRLPEDVIHQFIPLDAPRFVDAFPDRTGSPISAFSSSIRICGRT